MQKVQPVGRKLQLEIPASKVGGLYVDSSMSVQEQAVVVAVGPTAEGFKVKDHLLFKGWAIDIITIDDEKYYFIDCDSPGICAIVR